MLSVDGLVAGACAQTGLEDFGAPTWRPGLEVLVASLNAEARLNEMGELILGGQITKALVNRLRIVDWRREHPGVAAVPIDRPVFILGLPRTGTTLLSYLLDADPATRSLLRWEATDSIPPPDPATAATDPRLAVAQFEMDSLYEASPAFKAIHFEAADGPTECVTLMGQDFRSVHFETLANIPTYAEWHQACDMVPAYEWHRAEIEVLQWSWPGRWVLKSPCHNEALDALAAVYPDARFVFTHRDPVAVVGSTASLVSVLSGLGTDHDFDAYIGHRWLEFSRLMIDRSLEARSRLGDDRFYDLRYDDFVGDPMTALGALYDWLGWERRDDADRRQRQYLADSPKGRFGEHTYTLEQFGLTADGVAECFTAYSDRFGVAPA